MSDLAAAAAKLNVPEEILQRSAAARADAVGSSTESVLSAWAGGAAAPSASAPTPAVPEADSIEAEIPAASTEQAVPAAADVVAAVAPAGQAASQMPASQMPASQMPSTQMVFVADREPEIEPEPLKRRISVAGKAGAITGAVLSLMAWVFSAQFFLSKATMFGEEGAQTVGIEATTGRVVLGALLLSIAIGILVAGVARAFPAHLRQGMRLQTSPFVSGLVGGGVGLVVGGLLGALLVGMGTPVETSEGVSNLPMLSSVIWSLLLWAGGGWLVGAAVQSMAVPFAVAHDESDEVAAVSQRLGSALGVPVVAALAILALVLSMAFVFISFPVFAPLTGVIAAASILAFASISASKPSMRVRKADLFVAIAGIAAVLLVVISLLNAFGPETEHSEGEGAPVAEVTEEG